MKNKTKRVPRGTFALVVSLLIAAAVSVLLMFLGARTKYVSFYLVAALALYPALVNTILLIGGGRVSEPNKPERRVNEGKRWLRRIFSTLYFWLRLGVFYVRMWLLKRRTPVAVGLVFIITVFYQLHFYLIARRMTSIYSVGYVAAGALLVFFLIFVALEKWCKHNESEDERIGVLLRNLRGAIAIGRSAILLTMVAVVVKLLGYYDAQKWLVYILYVLWAYASVFIVISLVVRLVKKELWTSPAINIPLPFAIGRDSDLSLLSYLEKNTGITMRSLWSLRMIKAILPYTLIVAAALLWFATGLVQVESYQTGAVYRLGKIQDKLLEPGLHIRLPWPIEKVEIYNTEQVRNIIIGYQSTTVIDNTWSDTHGTYEYKLLLGSGDELVSINLRVEYKIRDLKTYLLCNSSPERVLEALAYELVTARTINTDLESLLSVNRSAFAEDFKNELAERAGNFNTGLEVVSVVLESIHPPVEVASVYQGIISAEIERDKYILEAEAKAAVTLAEAKARYDTALSTANSAYYTKTAEAKAAVAQFMASVAADNEYSDAYRYYKYIKAIASAYGGARLVIVGEGIDSS
ncbi:MAG: SPFH domain-containing protein, partial [Eubacteriales bacterium]